MKLFAYPSVKHRMAVTYSLMLLPLFGLAFTVFNTKERIRSVIMKVEVLADSSLKAESLL